MLDITDLLMHISPGRIIRALLWNIPLDMQPQSAGGKAVLWVVNIIVWAVLLGLVWGAVLLYFVL